MIETIAKNFSGSLLNFADVDQHPSCWIDRTAEDEIGNVIAAAAIARICFRTEHGQVFLLAPIFDMQPPRGRKFQTLADGEKHNVTPLNNREHSPAPLTRISQPFF